MIYHLYNVIVANCIRIVVVKASLSKLVTNSHLCTRYTKGKVQLRLLIIKRITIIQPFEKAWTAPG